MFLVFNSGNGVPLLTSLSEKDLILSHNSLSFYGESYIIGTSNDDAARFEDIVDALSSGDVNVYDVRKDIGYWKPKTRAHSTAKKASAKTGDSASS